MKILLAYLCNYQDREDYYTSIMPVGLVSIASHLEGIGHEVILANFSEKGYRKAVRDAVRLSPEIIGVSLFTHNRADSLRFVKRVKKQLTDVTVIAGGPHASFLSDELLKRYDEIDFIITGEGEKSFEYLLEELSRGGAPGRVISARRIDEPDSIPAPVAFKGEVIDLDKNEQLKYIITTRGCPHKCNFCCSPEFWGRSVRYRSAEGIVNEIERIHREYGIIYFSIRDDNFTLKKSRVIEFSRLLRERKLFMMWNCQSRADSIDEEMLIEMKLAGLEHIQYGVESGSERILELYDKDLSIQKIVKAAELTRRVGVYLSIYLMTGMTGEKRGDINKTIKLIKKILPGDGIVSPVALYPGTQLYNNLKEKGKISDAVWFKKKDSGIFLRDDIEAGNWVDELLTQISLIRSMAWYRERDFEAHHGVAGDECWVTDILEGDYYLDEERYSEAERCYSRVVSGHKDNLWGFFRAGKLKFITADYHAAEDNYLKVTELAPEYFGGWLKLAESQIAQDKRREARQSTEEAFKRNRFDFRILNLKRLLR